MQVEPKKPYCVTNVVKNIPSENDARPYIHEKLRACRQEMCARLGGLSDYDVTERFARDPRSLDDWLIVVIAIPKGCNFGTAEGPPHD